MFRKKEDSEKRYTLNKNAKDLDRIIIASSGLSTSVVSAATCMGVTYVFTNSILLSTFTAVLGYLGAESLYVKIYNLSNKPTEEDLDLKVVREALRSS